MEKTAFFAKHLRELRLERGMTQKRFGELLGFSEKTVSKWECGAALPDVSTLFRICECLKTDIDTLFSAEEVYFLGIDGGGTKTALLLTDKNGQTVRTLSVDGCNPVDIGITRAKAVLRDAIYQICEGIRFPCVYTFAGIAGGTTANMKEELAAFFESFRFASFENGSDITNIVSAGLGEEDGVTAVLGTGFCVFAQKDGVCHRTSGWGYLIDDGGSAYNLGRDALHAYFAAYDGSGEKTLLTEELDRLCPGGESALIRFAYGSPKKAIAALAPAVSTAILRGDPIAQKILERNMRVAADIIRCSAKPLGEKRIPVILAGGMTADTLVMEALRKELEPFTHLDIQRLNTTPVTGAVLLAQKLYGGKR